MIPVARNNRLVLRIEIRVLPQNDKTVLLNDLANDKALIYLQNSPGLNHLDAIPATLPNSLRPLISANRVRVYELELTGISHFRPALIYETRTQMTVRLATRGDVQMARYIPYPNLNPCPPINSLECGQEQETQKQRRVYVVVEK